MHFSSSKANITGAVLIILLLAVSAAAQIRQFRGKVTDDKGQPIAGATVIIQVMESKGRSFKVKTDNKGNFFYMGLPDGLYHVAARAPGFAPAFKSKIKASIAEEGVIDLQLSPGEDQKLPFEMTPEELKRLEEEAEKAKQRQESAADVQAFFSEGRRLAGEDKHNEAIEQFQKALQLDPQQASIIGHIAESYRKLGKLNEALEFYNKAIAINPKEAVLYTNLGVVLGSLGKSAESQEAFKKAAALNPAGSAQIQFNLGITLANSGRMEEAAAAFRQAIAVDTEFAEAYYQLGMCLSGKPETMDEAVKHFRKYLEIGQKPDEIEIAKAMIAALDKSKKK